MLVWKDFPRLRTLVGENPWQEYLQKILNTLDAMREWEDLRHGDLDDYLSFLYETHLPPEPGHGGDQNMRHWRDPAAKTDAVTCRGHLRLGHKHKRRPRATCSGCRAFFGSTKVNLRNAP